MIELWIVVFTVVIYVVWYDLLFNEKTKVGKVPPVNPDNRYTTDDWI